MGLLALGLAFAPFCFIKIHPVLGVILYLHLWYFVACILMFIRWMLTGFSSDFDGTQATYLGQFLLWSCLGGSLLVFVWCCMQ